MQINNKFFLSGTLAVAVSLFSSAYAGLCSTNASGALTESGCETLAEVYTVKFYELGLCTAMPTAPDANGSAADLSKCTKVYNNSDGIWIDAKKGVSAKLTGGTTTEPAAGSYTYAYMIMDPTAKVQAKVTYATDQQVTDNNGNVQTDKGTGTKCWTLESSVKASAMGTSYYRGPATVNCGAAFPTTIGTMSEITDIDADSQTACGGKYVNGELDTSKGWFCTTDDSLKRKTPNNTKLLFVMPITFTHVKGNNIDVKWNVSEGASVGGSGPGKITGIGAGPISPSFTDVAP